MRVGGFLLAAFIVGATGLSGGRAASAYTLSASGKVHLIGKVAPAHYIIVDGDGTILQVISNTDEDTVPLVYKDKLIANNQMPLTPAIYDQYRKIVPAGTSHPGVLYKLAKPQPAPTSIHSTSGLFLAQVQETSLRNNHQTGIDNLLKAAFPNAPDSGGILAAVLDLSVPS